MDDLVTVTLDKERHLRLTLRGMITFEQMMGKSLFKGFDLSKFTIAQTAALMYACLIHEDKELTYDAFLDIVDLGNMEKLKNAMAACILQALSTGEKEENEVPLAMKPPNG